VSSGGNFQEQVAAFTAKMDARANAVVRKIVFDVSTGLVMKTPVGDPEYWKSPPPPGYVGGRARGNWQYALETPVINETGVIDKSGGETISTIVGKVPDDAAHHIHYITNTLPYIKRLEDGWSRQAPHGMVHLTVIEFQDIIQTAVSEVK
jgi:hypothetical protein